MSSIAVPSPDGEKIGVAVLGATGAVGQRFIQLLEGHPWFAVRELVASDRSVGKRYAEAANWLVSPDIPPDVSGLPVKGLDARLESPVVVSSLPSDVAGEVELRLAKEGHRIFSNASNHRMSADVPLIVAEVNADHAAALHVQRQRLGSEGYIVTNGNCTTITLVLPLAALHHAFGVEAVIVTSLQAASGAGYPGVPSLDLIDNVVPYIGGEEEKLQAETAKMLGRWEGGQFHAASFPISATCTRVPVRDGHTESVSVRLRTKASANEMIAAWREFRGRPQELHLPSAPQRPVIFRDEQDRPQPNRDRMAEKGMASVVGRLRPCPILDWKFVVLGHNTIRGAAGASILNAELALAEGWL
ncbi:MAG: aspartate-semialdehyde dehydrogenase [Thermomicrobia bacterium]|nr:aspartate-semialdehyde dehydrogenase [Thermomicrobia bacterium]